MVIMCLRKLQNWSFSALRAENLLFCVERPTSEEWSFVLNFSSPFRAPASIPTWLWGGKVIRTHPSFHIRADSAMSVEAGEEDKAGLSDATESKQQPFVNGKLARFSNDVPSSLSVSPLSFAPFCIKTPLTYRYLHLFLPLSQCVWSSFEASRRV